MKSERWQRIEQMYHAALDSAPDQRPAFLAEACAGDDALRREIERLLAANEQAGGFLATPALELEAKNLVAENSAPTLAVQLGQAFNHYQILSRIGAGGMGEVFLARDTKLERRVALKLLPLQFTQNAERLQRFVREAKAASALNHPNIITIYEIGEVATELGNTNFIATEFIEGETLRTWTVDPEKRLRETLNIGVQVASALDAAHKAGIVHRDIKPENVMVRPDGLVKVLDFGLAKLTPQTSDSSETSAPTLVEEMKTRPGVILGTLRYMSPEQARGRSVDARSDIFSLGVVLYELLTGQPLFAGETDADVVAGIIHKEAPPLATYLTDAPAELDRIVQKALAKDTEERYQNARDLRIDLQALTRDSELSLRLTRSVATGKQTTQTSGVLAAPRFSLRQLLLGLTVALLLVGTVWWFAIKRHGRVETPPPESLRAAEVFSWQSSPGEIYSVGAFSPDGKWVAFTSTQGGSKNIWIKQAASGDAEASTKDDSENENPIWSPDGDEIAFFSFRGRQNGIWRKPMLGGTPTLLKTLESGESNVMPRYWSKRSSTIYYESQQNLFALDVNSGRTTKLTNFDSTRVQYNTISISPDEQHISYVPAGDDGSRSIWVETVGGGSAKQITRRFDDIKNTVWHPDGNRVFFSSKVNEIYQIFVADLAGHQPAQITFGDRDCLVLDVSGDGAKILQGSSREESDIWGVDVSNASDFAVSHDISFELWPEISPDGQTVAYQAVATTKQVDKLFNSSILTKPIGAGSKPIVQVKAGLLPKWSPDGQRLAFLRKENDGFGLWTVNATGGEEKRLTTGGLSSVEYAVLPYQRWQVSNYDWSPDGSMLAYLSDRNGQRNLWTVYADGANDTQTTDNTDSNLWLYCPLWSSDGKRIAYSSKTDKVAAGGKATYSICVWDTETKDSKAVLQANSFLGLIGWSGTGRELIVVTFNEGGKFVSSQTTDVALVSVATRTGDKRTIAILPYTYFYNVHLSVDKRTIAFTSHRDDKDNVWTVPVGGGEARKLTSNNDPRLYFSSLAWSPDGKAIYFGKQTRYSQLAMITNFE